MKESFRQGAADFKSDMEFTKASIDEISDETERKIEVRSEERIGKRKAKLEELQNKINDLGQAYAKADQEELIIGLLEYAEDCRATAVYMAEEAVTAYKAAADELAEYNKKYGSK